MQGASFTDAIRESGLVSEGDRGVVMVSGGPDSVALLIGLYELLGPENLVVLHVNFGLREEADSDESLVRSLCERLGVDLEVLRAGTPEGNVQAWARDLRHREAELLRAERGFDWVAVGHTLSDQVETFVYRLVSSPGVRSLLAMPPRSGRIIRPLLALSGQEIRKSVSEVAEYAEDASNSEPTYARNRIRLEVLPELERINPGVESNISRTRTELEADEDALTELAARKLEAGGAADFIDGGVFVRQHPAVARRMIRLLTERVLERKVAVTPELVVEATRLIGESEGGRLDMGKGDFLLIEAGRIRVRGSAEEDRPPEAVPISTGPGRTRFGEWEIDATSTTEDLARLEFGNAWTAFFELEGAEPWLRAWRPGDRIEPLGMSGSKKLQDVFTDGLVPATRRVSWPVLVTGETVLWVPGLVRSKHLLISHPDRPVLRLEAAAPFSD